MSVAHGASRSRSGTRLALLRAHSPKAAELARPLSLAVRIEPGLLRATRLELGMPAAVEADLWFSEVVASAGPLGVSLEPGVADLLRAELVAAPAERHRAWQRLQEWHGSAPWSIRLEERINYLATFGDAGADEIEELLAAAVERLREARHQDERRAIGIARWLLAASADCRRQRSRRAQRTRLRWPRACIWTAELMVPTLWRTEDRTRWLSWLLDSLGSVGLPLQLVQGGLALGGEPSRWAPSLRVPATDPLALSAHWRSDGVARLAHIQLRRGEERYLEVDADEIELRTVSGHGVVVRPAGVGTIAVVNSRGVVLRSGHGFAVTRDVVFTTGSIAVDRGRMCSTSRVTAIRYQVSLSLTRAWASPRCTCRGRRESMPVAGLEFVTPGARWRLKLRRTDHSESSMLAGSVRAVPRPPKLAFCPIRRLRHSSRA